MDKLSRQLRFFIDEMTATAEGTHDRLGGLDFYFALTSRDGIAEMHGLLLFAI